SCSPTKNAKCRTRTVAASTRASAASPCRVPEPTSAGNYPRLWHSNGITPLRMMRSGSRQEQPMKLHPAISAKLAGLQPNHVGLLPWSLLAHPLSMQAGGVPHQPDPDTPQPAEPG